MGAHLSSEPHSNSSNSMMSRLREQHQKLASATTIDIDLPGFNGELVAKYRLLDVTHELQKIGQRVLREFSNNPGEQALYGAIDSMVMACEGLFFRNADGELSPLSESIGPEEPPIKYDTRLLEFLGLPPEDTARGTVLALFARNEPLIVSHGQQLARWMRDTTKGVQSDFLTELMS